MHSVFVLCQNYPSEKDKYSMAFVHPRIKEYLKTGLDVKVISFACNCSYIYLMLRRRLLNGWPMSVNIFSYVALC